MSKKSIFIIFGIIILLLIGYFIIQDLNSINVDGLKFKIPDTYNVVDGDDAFNLTNGECSIYITKNTTSNINKTIEKYINSKEKSNTTLQLNKYNLNDIKVYKLNLENTTIVHYWFEKNNKVYEIYTWSGNVNTDLTINELIKSTESFL